MGPKRFATMKLICCGSGWLLGAVLLSACVAPPPPGALGVSSEAIGEPSNGFPSPDERLGIMAINRARSAPSILKGPSSMMYPAVKPVLWSLALSRSARFHATNLQLSKADLMHTSPCTLKADIVSANCAGDPSCACSTQSADVAKQAPCLNCLGVAAINTCGTDTFARIGMFTAGNSTSASGEVAAAGYGDPIAVVDGWVDEAAGADGHRTNLLDISVVSNVMGYGRVTGGSGACWSSFDVSDSGNQGGLTMPNLPTAAVSPSKGNAGSFTFYATWADAGGAPTSINVVVDGQCTPMTKEFSIAADTLNATYKVAVPLTSGCHNYRIVAHNAAGARQAYPTTGAVTISVGSACASDFLTSAPSAPCDVIDTPDLAGVSGDLAGQPGVDLAGTDGGPSNIGTDGGIPDPDGSGTSGGCAFAFGHTPGGRVLVFGLLLLAFALLRRSRSA